MRQIALPGEVRRGERPEQRSITAMTVVDIWDGAPAAPDGSGGAAGLLLPGDILRLSVGGKIGLFVVGSKHARVHG